MREILFRAKRLDNGEWVEGYYAVKGKDTDLEKHFIVSSTFDSNTNAYPFYFTDIEVDSESVCQYTGLTDKAGKKIFERDIVFAPFVGYAGKTLAKRGVAEFLNGAFSINWNDSEKCGKNFAGYVNDLEVIGNKFDNAELMEGKEKDGYLKPCPFCGGEAFLWTGNPKLHMDSTVSCSKCHITQSGHYETSEQAIRAWNKRVGE